jgi:hypothetical protein
MPPRRLLPVASLLVASLLVAAPLLALALPAPTVSAQDRGGRDRRGEEKGRRQDPERLRREREAASEKKAMDEARAEFDDLRRELGEGPDAIASVLRRYNTIESSEKFSIYGRELIHRRLVRAIGEMEDPAAADVAREMLGRAGGTFVPSQVVLMKALIEPRFPAPRAKRVALLLERARDRSERLQLWAVRLLAESRWVESIDALIGLQKEEELAGRFDDFLAHLAGSELYRVLGSKASYAGGAGKTERNWEEMGKKLPAEPDYGRAADDGVTVAFFGDRLMPRSVFLIDASGSMREKATLRGPERGGETAVGGERRRPAPSSRGAEPKIDIVKRELETALGGLREGWKFNVLSYNATYYPWSGGTSPKLSTARESSIRSATRFARELETAGGTNIHDTLVAALGIPEVETIYLLSDGAPSRGGTPAEIERRVAAMNYLLGVRIITYGFAAEAEGSFNEPLLQNLARTSWGWYRRLN